MWSVKFFVPAEHAIQAGEKIEEVSLSVSMIEKKSDPDIWEIEGLFRQKPSRDDLTNMYRNERHDFPNLYQFDLQLLTEDDWLKRNAADFPAYTVGRFYIFGSHIQAPLPEGKIPLQIDATMAFGTGEHETTQGCLQLMDYLDQKIAYQPQRPIDIGCGTGILAIAAVKTWGKKTFATDLDSDAIAVTQENMGVNGVQDHIKTLECPGLDHIDLNDKTFDLIVANILANPLDELAPDISRHLESGGYLILSGLLTTQTDRILERYAQFSCHLVHQIISNEWTAILLQKTS